MRNICKKALGFTLALALAVALTGCGLITPYHEIVQGSGRITTNRLDLSDAMGANKGGLKLRVEGLSFSSLGKSSFTAELVVDESLEAAVVWEADSNIANSFSVNFNAAAGEIVVKPLVRRVSFSPTRLRLHVGAPIRELQIDGAWNVTYDCPSVKSCTIEINGAGDGDYIFGDLDSLDLTIAGAADVSLKGSAARASYTVDGFANIRAFGLVARDVSITINGSGECELTATDTLSPQINGIGEIVYDGSPRISERSASGVGSVRSRSGEVAWEWLTDLTEPADLPGLTKPTNPTEPPPPPKLPGMPN